MRVEIIDFYDIPFHFDKRNLAQNEFLPVTRWLWNSKGVGSPGLISILWVIFQLIISLLMLCIDFVFIIILFHVVFKILIIKWIIEPIGKGLIAFIIPLAIILVIWLLVLSFKLGLW